MLHIELYNKISKLHRLEFLKNKERRLKVICPTPEVADNFRDRIKYAGRIDVITIHKYVSGEFRRVFPEKEIYNKASMLLTLGTVFKKIFTEGSYKTFFQAFDTFTELRAVTTDYHLISEVFSEYDPIVARALEVFWSVMESEELVDEHEAYSQLSEAYREIIHPVHEQDTNITESDNYIFWGFKHLSAGQVDLLKSLAIRHDVYVPCANSVYAKSRDCDWIRWLAPDLEVLDTPPKSRLNIVRFTKNRMGEVVHRLTFKPDEVFLATSSPNLEQLTEAPFCQKRFKSSLDLFSIKLDKLTDMSVKVCESDVTADALMNWAREERDKVLKLKDFRAYKVFLLFEETLQEYRDLSNDNEVINRDDLHILIHVVSLKLPRNSFVPSGGEGPIIKGLDSLDGFSESKRNIICGTSDYSPLMSREERYSDNMIEFFKSVGPVRRSEFLFSIVKHQIEEVLSSESSILLLETGLEEHNQAWAEILSSFSEKNNVMLGEFKINKKRLLDLDKRSWSGRKVSATLLQDYLDCPQKFFLKYVLNLRSFPMHKKIVTPAERGELEHRAIEEYFKCYNYFDEKSLRELSKKITHKVRIEKGLGELESDTLEEEIFNYSRNGLKVLFAIKEKHPESKFHFEDKLADTNVSGRIDCLIEFSDGVGIIDFKRSSSSVPPFSSIEKFKKIQLLFYMNHCQSNVVFASFMNLSEIEGSIIVGTSSYAEIVADLLGIKCRELHFDEYPSFESDVIKKIDEDLLFEATPSNSDVCMYCMVKNICSKGGMM